MHTSRSKKTGSHGWVWRALRPDATSISPYRRHRSTGQKGITHKILGTNSIYSFVMKKFSVHVLLVIVTVGLFSSCYDRGIVDAKDFDHSLPNVGGLAYTRSEVRRVGKVWVSTFRS